MSVAAVFFFFNDPTTTETYTAQYTLSLHDALPICLIHQDDIGNLLRSADAAVPVPRFLHFPYRLLQPRVENVVDEGGFSASTDARDAHQQTQRNSNVQILQIVLVRIEDLDVLPAVLAPEKRSRNLQLAPEVPAGQ